MAEEGKLEFDYKRALEERKARILAMKEEDEEASEDVPGTSV